MLLNVSERFRTIKYMCIVTSKVVVVAAILVIALIRLWSSLGSEVLVTRYKANPCIFQHSTKIVVLQPCLDFSDHALPPLQKSGCVDEFRPMVIRGRLQTRRRNAISSPFHRTFALLLLISYH